ncbi:MAG TPA: porin [Desulfobulbus sp.]|nr:porin [Desulfobulbus sp.]
MMKKRYLLGTAALLALGFFGVQNAQAGAKITISDDSNFDLGFRLQTLYLHNDSSRTSNTNEFKLRRARIRLKGNVTKWVTGFLQTDFSDDDINSGGDVRLIDGWIMIKPHKLFNVIGGLQMAAVTREGMTSSGGAMTMDRPGINNYMLTWGSRGRVAFNTATLAGTRDGLGGDVMVRDLGFSLFGSTSFTDTAHFKYYLGVFEGQDPATRSSDSERYTGRIQFNFLDAESGLFNLSTYLGKKKTIALGAGYDTQSDVAVDSLTGKKIDYAFYTFDAFVEYPVGPGSVTAEMAYNDLDLDDARGVLADEKTRTPFAGAVAAPQAQGSGFYGQIGYYIDKWQPWLMYEQWDSDGANDAGDWHAYRIGLSYFIKGHNANVKVGYEKLTNDTPGEEDVDTFVVGFYVTY